MRERVERVVGAIGLMMKQEYARDTGGAAERNRVFRRGVAEVTFRREFARRELRVVDEYVSVVGEREGRGMVLTPPVRPRADVTRTVVGEVRNGAFSVAHAHAVGTTTLVGNLVDGDGVALYFERAGREADERPRTTKVVGAHGEVGRRHPAREDVDGLGTVVRVGEIHSCSSVVTVGRFKERQSVHVVPMQVAQHNRASKRLTSRRVSGHEPGRFESRRLSTIEPIVERRAWPVLLMKDSRLPGTIKKYPLRVRLSQKY